MFRITCIVVTARGVERQQLGPEISNLEAAKKMREVWFPLREGVQIEDVADGRVIADAWMSK